MLLYSKYMQDKHKYMYMHTHLLYIVNTVCALIFAGFIFRVFANFAFFAFLNSRLLGTVVLKYSRIYGVSPYTIIVYGSCRGAKLLESLL